MKYSIELDMNAAKPVSHKFDDAGAARQCFANARQNKAVFSGRLFSISETGSESTLERIQH